MGTFLRAVEINGTTVEVFHDADKNEWNILSADGEVVASVNAEPDDEEVTTLFAAWQIARAA
jgi:hypothetical protein